MNIPFEIHVGANNSGANFNVPFYIEVIQSNNVVFSAFSTERGQNSQNPTLVKAKTDFNNALPTTIKFYNLGKKTNIISINLIDINLGQSISTGAISATDGKVVTVPNLNLSGNVALQLGVVCNESSQTLSGVDYIGSYSISGTLYSRVASRNLSDVLFIGVETPNVQANPNYLPGIEAGGLVDKPILSASEVVVGSTITITNYSQVGYDSMEIRKYDAVEGSIVVVSGGGDFTLVSGVYTFLQSGIYSFIGKKSGYQDSVSGGLIVRSTLPKPDPNRFSLFVNEFIFIKNASSFTSISVFKDGNIATTTDVVADGSFYTFLKAGVFTFVGKKPSVADSEVSDAVVVSRNTLLPKPIVSETSVSVGQTVFITNKDSYLAVNCYENGELVGSSAFEPDNGGYKFVRNGTFQFIGFKPGFELSDPSDDVVVATSINKRFRITSFEAGVIAVGDEQIGTGPNVQSVTNWVDGLVITVPVVGSAYPKIWLRSKTYPEVVSTDSTPNFTVINSQ